MAKEKEPQGYEFHNAVKEVENKEDLKLLTRDERKEYSKLRELLKNLTGFQIRFVEQYIRTASAGKAARLAGSNSATPEIVGYKILQIPTVQMAISIAMKKRIEAVGLDTVEVIQKTREVYDSAMQAGKFEAANKAIELLQKEIERATKYSLTTNNLTKAGQAALGPKESKPIHEEDGYNVQNDLENVISILKIAESRE